MEHAPDPSCSVDRVRLEWLDRNVKFVAPSFHGVVGYVGRPIEFTAFGGGARTNRGVP